MKTRANRTPRRILPPTMRERHRYIKFQIMGEAKFNKEQALKSMNRTGMRFFGELEFSRIRPWLIDFDSRSQTGILRTNHTRKDEAKTILFLITELEGRKARIHCQGVSGTIKKVREKNG